MENKCLQAELDWIDGHPQFYHDAKHQEDVKHNVTVNYEIRELEARINVLKASRREINPAYTTVRCPPIPKTKDELVMEARGSWKDALPTGVDATFHG